MKVTLPVLNGVGDETRSRDFELKHICGLMATRRGHTLVQLRYLETMPDGSQAEWRGECEVPHSLAAVSQIISQAVDAEIRKNQQAEEETPPLTMIKVDHYPLLSKGGFSATAEPTRIPLEQITRVAKSSEHNRTAIRSIYPDRSWYVAGTPADFFRLVAAQLNPTP